MTPLQQKEFQLFLEFQKVCEKLSLLTEKLTSAENAAAQLEISDEAKDKLYKKLRFQAFLAGTIGYSLYYVCRTSLNVVKKPILDSGMLDASQLGLIGSVLLFAYASHGLSLAQLLILNHSPERGSLRCGGRFQDL